MAVFAVFELKGGRIQGLGEREFKEVPSRGEFIKFAKAKGLETARYEVLEVEFRTDTTAAGDIVLGLTS
jgi:hypothetical protein